MLADSKAAPTWKDVLSAYLTMIPEASWPQVVAVTACLLLLQGTKIPSWWWFGRAQKLIRVSTCIQPTDCVFSDRHPQASALREFTNVPDMHQPVRRYAID